MRTRAGKETPAVRGTGAPLAGRAAVRAAILGALLLGATSGPALAQENASGGGAGITRDSRPAPVEPTRVMIRVLARDAKLIGTGVGGARVVVTDVADGSVLAEGVHVGSTGDTDRIMRERPRRGAFSTEGAAGFLAEIPLRRPTVVEVSAWGPLADRPERPSLADPLPGATKRLLLVPGEHVLGDGVVLELNGFTVELLDVPRRWEVGEVPVRARVTHLCGCPLTPGGLWDAADVSVRARLLDERGRVVSESTLAYQGEPSTFAGNVEIPEPGLYTVEVLAAQPDGANFGRASRSVVAP